MRTSRGSGGAGRRRRRGTAALATAALLGAVFSPQAVVALLDDEETLGTAREHGITVAAEAKLQDDVISGAVPAADATFPGTNPATRISTYPFIGRAGFLPTHTFRPVPT